MSLERRPPWPRRLKSSAVTRAPVKSRGRMRSSTVARENIPHAATPKIGLSLREASPTALPACARGALLFHPGVKALERDQRRIERVGGVRAGRQQQVRIPEEAADRRFYRP